MVLASHLPWLLHLLLLTDVGCMPDDKLSDRVAVVNNEGSENLSATTVQHIASSGSRDSRAPEEGQWEVPRSADSHSVEHGRLSTSMASNATAEEDEVIPHSELGSLSQPSTMDLLSHVLCSVLHLLPFPRSHTVEASAIPVGLVQMRQGPHTGRLVSEV